MLHYHRFANTYAHTYVHILPSMYNWYYVKIKYIYNILYMHAETMNVHKVGIKKKFPRSIRTTGARFKKWVANVY